jgi:hypothetical protein
MQSIRIHPLVAGLVLVALAALGLGAQQPQPLYRLTVEQAAILGHLSLVMLPDGHGGQVETIRISGVNLQLVNGVGSTYTQNGAGNLIVGYGEPAPVDFDARGSHNVVVGTQNSYASYGGLVAGLSNRLDAPYTTVAGGSNNVASGLFSVVCGGTDNVAGDAYTAVLGGIFNEAMYYASSIVGGELNRCEGYASAVVGGSSNVAAGQDAVVGGGLGRSAPGDQDWVAGSLFEDD